jgi:tetratricopeptide (TPR) repeat protein
MSQRDDAPATRRRWPTPPDAEAERIWPVKDSGVLERQDRLLREQLGEGDAALERGDADAAASLYVDAIDQLRQAPQRVQAEAYVRLGRANRVRGRTMASVHCLKKALTMAPHHVGALEELVTLHAEWNEWDSVERVEEDLFAAIADRDDLVRELLRAGDRWWRRAGDPARAESRYLAALELDPIHESTQARLRALADSQRRAEALATLRSSAEKATDPADRARRWLELGRVSWFELHRHGEAITAFENAFLADPTLIEAMELLTTALVDRKQWDRLETWWRRLADAKTPAAIAARTTLREALRHAPADAPRPKRPTLPWFDRSR